MLRRRATASRQPGRLAGSLHRSAVPRVGGLPHPGLQDRFLQRATVREALLRGLWAAPVDRVEIGRRLLGRLATGPEIDIRNRRGHRAPHERIGNSTA